MKLFDALDDIEKATRRSEALALAVIAMAEADLHADYIGEVGGLAADEAKRANTLAVQLLNTIRKENAASSTSANGVQGVLANGDLAGAPYDES